jgi:N-acetylneuraminic acid mutarotase/tetratricopeptide (TPR) repeat protein
LSEQEKLSEAEGAYRQAIATEPGSQRKALHLLELRGVLYKQQNLTAAVQACREALALQPDFAEAHWHLGVLLTEQGQFADSLASLKRAHELGAGRTDWRHRSAESIRHVERFVALDAKLTMILKGEGSPADASEQVAIAELCALPCRQLFAAAARFYSRAFVAEPRLAEDFRTRNRYSAACAAALAGCGQGKDDTKPDATECDGFRAQSLSWLRADLTAWTSELDKEGAKARPAVLEQMRHWKQDRDFNGVRGAKALAKLAEVESRDWQKLWQDVEALERRAGEAQALKTPQAEPTNRAPERQERPALKVSQEHRGKWSAAASMAVARSDHEAILLNNHKVLVVGGRNDNGVLASAELYDPDSNTWCAAGSMATGRFWHAATRLGNGNVLVTAGKGVGGCLSNAELYDPRSNTWSAAGVLTTARALHAATLLKNDKVLVTGGFGNSPASSMHLATAELFDPDKNTWSPAADMDIGCSSHTATLLRNGKVLIAGGEANPIVRGPSVHLSATSLYDPAKNTWSPAGFMAKARSSHTAMDLKNGMVLVVGGFNSGTLIDAELYDSASDTWFSAGTMAISRIKPAATLLSNGMVSIAGGITKGPFSLSDAELYEPDKNRWSSAGSMATTRGNCTATLLANGKVLVLGGVVLRGPGNGSAYLSSAELYDPDVPSPASPPVP